MNNKGLHISYRSNENTYVELIDILKEVPYPELFCWSIFELLDAMGDIGEGRSLPEFAEKINNNPIGMIIEWEKLIDLAPRFYQIIDMTIIGCKTQRELENLAKKWKELPFPHSEVMLMTNSYFFIQMFDGWFWKVFSKDRQFIQKLSRKFEKAECITPEANFFSNPK